MSVPDANKLTNPEISRVDFAAAMDQVTEGMTEADVLSLLGPPHDVQTRHDPGGLGSHLKEIWRYGTAGHLTPATLGQVYFDRAGLVRWAFGKGQPHTTGLVSEDELRPLLMILDRGRAAFASPWLYNPLVVIEAVNRLLPLGKETALAVLEEYLRIKGWFEYKQQDILDRKSTRLNSSHRT